MSQQEQENKNRLISFMTSLGFHGVLILLFIFAMGWTVPNPPFPEYGMLINVGFDDVGTGDVQTDKPVTQPDPQPEQKEQVEEKPVEPEVKEVRPVEKVDKEEIITSKTDESPVVIKETKPAVKEEPKKKEPEKLKTEYKKEDTKSNSTATQNNGEKTVSQGDDKGKTGNKGQPDGTLNESTIYKGKPGGGDGGDGMGLAMSGWAWAEQPKVPELPDNESGQIIFEIECDEQGEITGIKVIENGLSPKAEQILRAQIQKSSLQRTSSAKAPERSKGRVVFRLKTQ